jgi:hypothetical protein
MKKLIMILCLIGIFLFTTSLVLAGQGKGADKKGDTPHGFTKGNKTGWQGSDTPPGWNKDKHKNKGKHKNKDSDRDRNRDKDSDRDKDKDRNRDSDRDSDRDKDKHKDRDSDRDRDRNSDLNKRP